MKKWTNTALISSFSFLLIACMADTGKFGQVNICKAAISVVMGRPVSIMSASTSGDVTYISYTRSDGTRWRQKCKLQGSRIIWGAADGRWRTHQLDGKINFSISGNTLTVTEEIGDSPHYKKFNLGDF